MEPTLAQGATHSVSRQVDEAMTVPHAPGDYPLFVDMPEVLATAALVTFVEAACADALAPHLDHDEVSVGTAIDLTHSAPTPVGGTIRATVEVAHLEERTVSFSVTVSDDEEVVSVGTHTRVVVRRDRFDEKVAEKAERLGR
ncbi:MAG: thioesterase family protein [Actinobacteria bacterium]|nr:thioesterase family protein [Actinomycetota bacterium]